MKKKIFLHLNGGCGNQLFQYAAARNLALIHKAELVIDTNSSIIFEFKRKFYKFLNREKTELGEVYNGCHLSIKNHIDVKYIKFNFTFILYRLLKKIFNLKKIIYINKFFVFYDDTNSPNVKNFLKMDFDNRLYLFGFFQDQKYFELNKKIIINEILSHKVKKKYATLLQTIKHREAIVLAVRYHESKIYNIKYPGVNNNLNFYKKSLAKMLKKKKNPKFFIFSTKQDYANHAIKQIPLLKKYTKTYLTADLGYSDAYSTFWLMSHCRNQIISASTLYWWSAYVSHTRFENSKIFCDKRFAKKQTILNSWIV